MFFFELQSAPPSTSFTPRAVTIAGVCACSMVNDNERKKHAQNLELRIAQSAVNSMSRSHIGDIY
eukprot:scaffold209589_cov35-Tisochrysis_lutea.AAC.7